MDQLHRIIVENSLFALAFVIKNPLHKVTKLQLTFK